MANNDDQIGHVKGRVKNVCKQITLQEDENLAFVLQNQEFRNHYDKNRNQRKSIRADLPLAKTIQEKEYQDLLRKHQILEKIEKEDAILAQEEQKRIIDELNMQMRLQQLTDEACAKSLQMQNEKYLSNKDSSKYSNSTIGIDSADYNNKEYLKKLQEKDAEIARYLQEQEKRKLQLNTKQNLKKYESDFINDEVKLARILKEEERNKYRYNLNQNNVL